MMKRIIKILFIFYIIKCTNGNGAMRQNLDIVGLNLINSGNIFNGLDETSEQISIGNLLTGGNSMAYEFVNSWEKIQTSLNSGFRESDCNRQLGILIAELGKLNWTSLQCK